MKNKTKNYGLNLDLELKHKSEEDWVFGGFSQPCLFPVPLDVVEKYLPDGEVQAGIEDFMDCATRAPLNILETKFNYAYQNSLISPVNRKWLVEKGYVVNERITFSDRFVAINSNTTRVGNSLKAPVDAIRKQGLIPKAWLPKDPEMDFDAYHNKNDITSEMRSTGLEFSRRFSINYEQIYEQHFGEEDDMLDGGTFAWPTPVDGVYPRVEEKPNHAIAFWNKPKYRVFDNYSDSFDGDFLKTLAPDYDFVSYAYRIFITGDQAGGSKGFWEFIKNLFRKKNENS